MFNPKLALSLSFFCCGLGQLYKHEITKGIVLIIIYAMLVVSLIFFPVPAWLLYVGLLLTSLLWIANLLDAYFNTGGCINDERGFVLEPFLSNTIFLTACLSSIFLASFWIQFVDLRDVNSSKETKINEIIASQVSEIKEIDYSKTNLNNEIHNIKIDNNEVDNKNVAATIPDDKIPELKKNPELDELYQIEAYRANSKFYTLQVGAFQMLENARELYDEVTSKGYQAWIEPPRLPISKLYCVLVGEFNEKIPAISYGKKLLQQEGLKSALVVRHQTEKIKFAEDEKMAYTN